MNCDKKLENYVMMCHEANINTRSSIRDPQRDVTCSCAINLIRTLIQRFIKHQATHGNVFQQIKVVRKPFAKQA